VPDRLVTGPAAGIPDAELVVVASRQKPGWERGVFVITPDAWYRLGEPIDRLQPEGEWAVRVYHKPFVDWIWGGCVLMALGGLIAILDRRYRVKSRQSSTVSTGNTQTA